jgi:hypothetical protein
MLISDMIPVCCGISQEFFADIIARPSSSLGEGTMAVRVAVMSAAQCQAPGQGQGGGAIAPQGSIGMVSSRQRRAA